MKKIILFTAVACMFTTSFVSCKKDSPATPRVFPVETDFVTELISGKVLTTDAATYEEGVKFKSFENGNIKSIKINLPGTGNKLVTLWRASDHSVVASKTITSNNIKSWDNSIETTIPIEANTEYILSINSSNTNKCTVPAGTFPFTKGNITILNFAEHSGAFQSFPDHNTGTTLFGFVDFTFQKSSAL